MYPSIFEEYKFLTSLDKLSPRQNPTLNKACFTPVLINKVNVNKHYIASKLSWMHGQVGEASCIYL
jgi:hypothetical protein